jgi:hypothetical protein
MPGASVPDPRGFSDLINLGVTQVFLDTYWENRIVDNVFTEWLKKFGQITHAKKLGKYAEWTARVAKYDSEYRGRGVRRNFAAKQLRVAYAAAYSRLEMPAVFYEEDIEDMDDAHAMRWLDSELKDMSDDFMIDLNERLIGKHAQDSNTLFGVAQDTQIASGDPGLIGLIDMFSYGATAYQYDPASAPGTTAMSSAIVEVLPNGTYCGVTTHPTTAISGVNGTRITGATSPVIINADTSDTRVINSSGNAGWAGNAGGVLDYAIVRCRRGNKTSDRPQLLIGDETSLAQLKRNIRDSVSEEVMITASEKISLNKGLILRQYVPYGPVSCIEDQDCPSGVRYLLHPSQFEFWCKPRTMLSTGKQIIKGRTDAWFDVEQQYDIDEGGQKLVGVMKAQCWGNPFRQGIITDFSVL